MSTPHADRPIGTEHLPGVAWRISSRSASGSGDCVEAGRLADGSHRVALRHSHHPDGVAYVYTDTQWANFLTAAKHGTYDF